jgi:cyclase
VPIVASGGADGEDHMLDAIRAGADAVLAASIFHGGDITVKEVKTFLASHGVPAQGDRAGRSVRDRGRAAGPP